MKIDKPENSNYAAVVVEIKNIIPLENCDNVVGTTILGFNAIVSNDTKIGDRGIVFPAETQLADAFCSYNNLYRHSDRNQDKGKKGYIEDNRRIRAQKFRGHVSSCLFMSLDSLKFTRINIDKLSLGDEFDTLNGHKICNKYVIKVREGRENKQRGQKKDNRVDKKLFPEHFDTDNFFKFVDGMNKDSDIIVTAKLDGTSVRAGQVVINRKLNIFEKILSKLGIKIQKTDYDFVAGSRRVIKDVNNPDHLHFYGTDIHTHYAKFLEGLLPENYIVYGELVGWTPEGTAIQKNYTYSIPNNTADLYVYRVAIVNNQGIVTDLSWNQVKEFCNNNGLKYVPELWTGKLRDFVVEDFLDKRFFESGYKHCPWLGENEDIVDEGVCVRVDGMRPYILKAKSPIFLMHESKILDTGEEDLESQQSGEDN